MVKQALTQEPNDLTGAVARDPNAITERPFGVRCRAGVKREIEYEKNRKQRAGAIAVRIDIRCNFSSFLNTFVRKLVFVFHTFIKTYRF